MSDKHQTWHPLILNIGIDCEDVNRWRKMLDKLLTGPQAKLFSSGEHQYCRSFKDPAPHYAARWCAKEALLKALSTFYKLDLRDVEVANGQDGKPYFIFSQPRVDDLNLIIKMSLSHTKDTAVAVVMIASSTT